MQLIVSRKPCLLLEAAELVFAQFNHIPAETVVIPGEYCIPAEEVERIQSQICALLPMNGKQVSFYFRAFHTEDHPSSPTCLSFCLLYISLAPIARKWMTIWTNRFSGGQCRETITISLA